MSGHLLDGLKVNDTIVVLTVDPLLEDLELVHKGPCHPYVAVVLLRSPKYLTFLSLCLVLTAGFTLTKSKIFSSFVAVLAVLGLL